MPPHLIADDTLNHCKNSLLPPHRGLTTRDYHFINESAETKADNNEDVKAAPSPLEVVQRVGNTALGEKEEKRKKKKLKKRRQKKKKERKKRKEKK